MTWSATATGSALLPSPMRCFWHASDSLLQQRTLGRNCRSGRLCRAQYLRAWFRWPLLPRLHPHDEVTAIVVLRGRRRREGRFGRRRGSSAGGRGGVVCAVVCRCGSLTSEHCLVLGGAPCSLPCLACVGPNSQPHGIAARLAEAATERGVAAQHSAAQVTANAGAAQPCKRAPSGWSTQALAVLPAR
jgi:hypothetical protein